MVPVLDKAISTSQKIKDIRVGFLFLSNTNFGDLNLNVENLESESKDL